MARFRFFGPFLEFLFGVVIPFRRMRVCAFLRLRDLDSVAASAVSFALFVR